MAHDFVITPCASVMDNRPPDLRLVRVIHSFTGRVVLETTHPRLWQVRIFLVKCWTWNAIRKSLPEGYTRFNVDLIYDRRPLHPFRVLMSITDEDVLELEYVIKELRVPSPRTRRDIAEAISRHHSDLIYELLCKYKVPELVKVMRGETISPVALLLWTLYPTFADVRLVPRALESLLAARCSPNLGGEPARAPLSIAVAANDAESVEELLSYQADPNVASPGIEPPLCVAVRHRRRNIVSALLAHRADVHIRSFPTAHQDVALRRELGLTPMDLAAGDDDMTDLLNDRHLLQCDVNASAFDM